MGLDANRGFESEAGGAIRLIHVGKIRRHRITFMWAASH